MVKRKEIFIAFDKEDDALLKELEKHLRSLEMEGLITVWNANKIMGGTDWRQQINQHLETADIVLLLVSANFMASNETFGFVRQALEKSKQQNVRVIPVLLQEVDWTHSIFGGLAPLPANGKPVATWKDRNAAFLNVVQGIRQIVSDLDALVGSSAESSPTSADDNSSRGASTEPSSLSEKPRFPGERPNPAIAPPPLGTTLLTYDIHSSWILAVAWSPDGTRIASAGGDGTVRVWQAVTGRHILTYHSRSNLFSKVGLSPSVRVVAWSPDSTRIASASEGKTTTVNVWDAATGHNVSIYRGHSGLLYDEVQAVAWSPDGTRIASARKANTISTDRTVHVWDVATGNTILRCDIHSGWTPAFSVTAVAWSPDGTRIACACSDKTIQVLNAASGAHITTYPVHSDWIGDISWSPDSKYIASANSDGTVRIWDTTIGDNSITYHGHVGSVRDVAWSPDGTRIASASHDKTVQIWNAATRDHIFTYHGHSASVYAVAWSPDSTRVASAGNDKTVQVWQAM